MSEKIYALLLRLYPAHFREAYGNEALQLLRDRARDERGFFQRLRFWTDLLADLIVSLPREYHNLRPARVAALTRHRLEGVPCFDVLEDISPRPGALLTGGILSLAALIALPALINHAGDRKTERASACEFLTPVAARVSSFLSRSVPSAESLKSARVATGMPQLPDQQRMPQYGGSILAQATTADTSLDAAERRRVIGAAIKALKQYYFDREVAQKTVDALLAHEENGDDNSATEGGAFADLLTKQMRDASHDMHLVVEYSRNMLPMSPPEQTAESRVRYRESMEQQNCMFRKVEMLPHNIGYLKLDFFPDTSVCKTTAVAAMASLNHADAIIFDLRDSTGGFPDMVSLIASYLFDHPEYMYSPRGAPTEDSWTRSPVPGNRLADKPVYVLTSATTWSGAEQFSYDLKMLKRATLVGETTRGGAHAGVFHRLDDHFGMGIPEEKAINPFGKSDWEGVGVEPDVKVKSADALETAVKLAEAKLEKKQM
jgi:Peptidase family S41